MRCGCVASASLASPLRSQSLRRLSFGTCPGAERVGHGLARTSSPLFSGRLHSGDGVMRVCAEAEEEGNGEAGGLVEWLGRGTWDGNSIGCSTGCGGSTGTRMLFARQFHATLCSIATLAGLSWIVLRSEVGTVIRPTLYRAALQK